MLKDIRVLIVDDNALNLTIIRGILEEDYILDFAKTGKEALEIAKKNTPDIILLDIMMPDMDGYEVLSYIKKIPTLSKSKIIMISALVNLDSRLRGYQLGAHDFIGKPFDDDELKAKIDIFSELTHTRELKEAFDYTIAALSRAAEASDEETGFHIVRVNEYSYTLARDFGLDDQFCRQIRCFAQMHDVGKIHVNKDVLNKRGRLTREEFAEIKAHPIYGAKIIGDSNQLRMAFEIAMYHHEKWDGSGYPNGLAGINIPIAGRIVAIADVYDALRNERCYKPAYSHEKTMDIFKNGDDRLKPNCHFDPALLEIFIANHEKYEAIFNSLC